MDGWTLVRDVRELLNESSTSSFITDRTTYDYLYEAACDLNSRIQGLTGEQEVKTVANVKEYELNEDFMGLFLRSEGRYVLKFNNGTFDSWLRWRDFDFLYVLNTDRTATIPNLFTIKDAPASSPITGQASESLLSVNGECTLKSSTEAFSDVCVGDLVHNTTDDSHGVVVAVTSNTEIVTALFEGLNNYWEEDDYFVITQRGRYNIILDPTPSESNYTLYVPYIKKLEPVYSPYRTYPFPGEFRFSLAKYAAWLYKYRDREPNYGDAWYKHYNLQSGTKKYVHDKNINSRTLKVQMKRRD